MSTSRLGRSVPLVVGVLTALAVVWTGGRFAYVPWALLYVGMTAAVVKRPGLLSVQVVVGTALVGALLVDPGGPGPLVVLPLVVGLLATGELLGATDRAGPASRTELARAGGVALAGGGLFGLVALLGRVPSPGGLVAVGVASVACVAAAALVARAGI